MEELLSLPEIEAAHGRALRRLGRTAENGDAGPDAELADALARELSTDRSVPAEIRRAVLRSLVGPTPGGLQALGWLARNDRLDPEAVQAWAGHLPIGPPPGEEGLNEREAVEAVDSLLRGVELPRLGRLGVCVRILASPLLQEAARAVVLRHVLGGPWLTPGDRRTLVEWSLGAEVVEEIAAGFAHAVPVAPASLARTALVCLVEQGDEVAVVVRYALTHLASWSEPRPVLQGLMDLLERSGPEVQPALRRQALDVVRKQRDPVLRRRAYQVAARTEGEDFLREALRDKDAGVRSWALSRLNRPSSEGP